MTDSGPIGNIHSLKEAADQLRMTPRAVAKVARVHGLCAISGRNLLFSDADIIAIWNVLRCPSSSPSETARKTGKSGVRAEEKAYLDLLAHATAKAQRKSASRSKLSN